MFVCLFVCFPVHWVMFIHFLYSLVALLAMSRFRLFFDSSSFHSRFRKGTSSLSGCASETSQEPGHKARLFLSYSLLKTTSVCGTSSLSRSHSTRVHISFRELRKRSLIAAPIYRPIIGPLRSPNLSWYGSLVGPTKTSHLVVSEV